MTSCRRIGGFRLCVSYGVRHRNTRYSVFIPGHVDNLGTVIKSHGIGSGKPRYTAWRANDTVCASDERTLQKATDCLFREWDENRAYAERDKQYQELAEERL